jgi:serine/threonine-protein kinase
LGTALATLKRARLVGRVIEEREVAGARAGLVLEQNPVPGSFIDEGSTVDLVVSKAPPTVRVPQVADRTVEEAQKAVEGEGLTFAAADQGINQSLPCNSTLVRDSEPKADDVVPMGTTVTVSYFRGLPCRVG